MNAEVKEKWIAALRSGEYKQGQERLRDGDSFCCLGVLCDIAAQDNLGKWGQDASGHWIFTTTPEEKDAYELPPGIQQWAGVERIGRFDASRWLADDNDRGSTFTEIANTIEKYF